MNGALFGLKEGVAFGFNLPEIPGLGTTSGLEMNLQLRGGSDVREFGRLAQGFAQDANQLPEAQGVNVAHPHRRPAALREGGRGGGAVARGGDRPDLFDPAGAALDPVHQRLQPLRADLPGAGRGAARVPAAGRRTSAGSTFAVGEGAMLPLSALVQTEMRGGPSLLTRFNGFPSALVTGTPKAGRSSGEMLDAVEDLVADKYAGAGDRLRLQRPVVSGARVRRPERAGARAGPGDGVPGARRAVRELVDSVRGPARDSLRRPRRVPRRVAPGERERRVLPGGADHGDRPGGQERHPDRGVRQTSSGPRDTRSATRRWRRRGSGSGRS